MRIYIDAIDLTQVSETMPIVLITPPMTLPNEHLLLNAMLHRGLTRVHLRKPGHSLEAHITYIQPINPEYRNRITLHDFHELSHKFSLGGIHYRTRQLPKDLIPAPSPTQLVSLGFHNPEDLSANRGDVGYCFLSPIYESISKAGYGPGTEIADRQVLAKFISNSRYPVVALGGKPLFFVVSRNMFSKICMVSSE
jgi:thiamine-phosphate pyrophosphorylase